MQGRHVIGPAYFEKTAIKQSLVRQAMKLAADILNDNAA
jgi:hypothetical protein